jgi:subtilase family serine protease
MKKQAEQLIIVGLLLSFVLTGCGDGAAKPDLVPVSLDESLGPVGYCQRGSSNQFTVTVKNQGAADAPLSKITIEFSPGGSFTEDLFGPGTDGALPPGVAWDIQFQNVPPSNCFNPDCDFKITVDSDKQIDESNEQNNSVEGRCIG